MTSVLPQCQNLQKQVETLLNLLHQEPSLRVSQDITVVQASLRKAIAPVFEIVFAGAFSAGKSMLINALLERELLSVASDGFDVSSNIVSASDSDKVKEALEAQA